MPNTNFSTFAQGDFNLSDHDANAVSAADSGGNLVLGGLLAINAGNPANATATAVNLAPISQSNTALDLDTILDSDVVDIL